MHGGVRQGGRRRKVACKAVRQGDVPLFENTRAGTRGSLTRPRAATGRDAYTHSPAYMVSPAHDTLHHSLHTTVHRGRNESNDKLCGGGKLYVRR